MERYRYLILGAGPAGLAVAHTLLQHGEDSFLVLEKESRAGGLCRSEIVDGSALDTGGGHFLDTRDQRVLDFLFRFMPLEEWSLFDRKSSIDFGDFRVDYPLESNIWQLPVERQTDYLMAIAASGENRGLPPPDGFREWITWKLGERIAEDYMLPYNRKIWSAALDELGTYWLEKLPAVSFREVLSSCLSKRPQGTVPAHRTFYYPVRTGYGQVWDRMGRALGDRLLTGYTVTTLDVRNRQVNGQLMADRIILTIPLPAIGLTGVTPEVQSAVTGLRSASIQIDYFPEDLNTDDQWIYLPDESLPHHRILNRRVFVSGSRGYWTESNSRRKSPGISTVALNEYAYPLNTRGKPVQMAVISDYLSAWKVFGTGRWGLWEHINSDVAVRRGIELAERLISSGGSV